MVKLISLLDCPSKKKKLQVSKHITREQLVRNFNVLQTPMTKKEIARYWVSKVCVQGNKGKLRCRNGTLVWRLPGKAVKRKAEKRHKEVLRTNEKTDHTLLKNGYSPEQIDVERLAGISMVSHETIYRG
jgi:uncharacterized protein YbaR (Trm112 family)